MGSDVVPQDVSVAPPLDKVVDTVDPAASEATIPQALIHLAFPSGQRPNMRNWPESIPERLSVLVEVMAAVSATGTPIQNGSFVRATPPTLPGYSAS